MIKYYTRACNFYYGSISKEKIRKKLSIPLHGNELISFDTIEIISRKNIKRINVTKSQKVIDISPVIDEPMNPTSFQDIKDGLCRWPIGEPEDIDFKFCGRNTNEGFVYCQAHHKQAYQPLSKVRGRKKIIKKFRIS